MRIIEILGEVLGTLGDARSFRNMYELFPALGGILGVLLIVFLVVRAIRIFRKISDKAESEFPPLKLPRELHLEGPEDRRGVWIRK